MSPLPEDAPVNMSCVVDANPNSQDFIRWQQDMSDIPGGRSGTYEFNVTRSSGGYYRCLANNGIGDEAISDEYPLTVWCKYL